MTSCCTNRDFKNILLVKVIISYLSSHCGLFHSLVWSFGSQWMMLKAPVTLKQRQTGPLPAVWSIRVCFFWFNVVIMAAGFIWRRLIVLVSVPVEMQIKALRWCSSNGRAGGCTLACHRCLWISVSSRNGLHWSKTRSLPFHRLISQHAAPSFTTHSYHFHSFSLWHETTAAEINVQSHCCECLMATTKTEDSFLLLSPPCCHDCFLFLLPSLQFIHQFYLCLYLFYHHHPAMLYSFTAILLLD